MWGSGTARVIGALLALVVAACGVSTPTSAPSPSVAAPSASPVAVTPTDQATPFPSPTADASPSAEPRPTELEFLGTTPLSWVNRFVMRVAVSDLNVREAPTKDAKSRGKAPKGGLFMMYDWPRQADGYTWYYGFTLLTTVPNVLPDLPTSIETGYDEVLGGWMATGTEDAPFLMPLAPRCPTAVDQQNVAAMLASERISCFGSETIELEGRYHGEGCGGSAPGTFEPGWLANPLECGHLDPRIDSENALPLYLHVAPDGPPLPADGAVVRIRGHVSDARSTTCRISVLDNDGVTIVKIPNDAAEQWCRARFVVESFEVIG